MTSENEKKIIISTRDPITEQGDLQHMPFPRFALCRKAASHTMASPPLASSWVGWAGEVIFVRHWRAWETCMHWEDHLSTSFPGPLGEVLRCFLATRKAS